MNQLIFLLILFYFQIIAENCPACFEAPKVKDLLKLLKSFFFFELNCFKERMRIKHLLAQQELNFSTLFSSLLNALKPLVSINKCQLSIRSLSEYSLKLVQNDLELYNKLISLNSNNKEENSV